MRTRPLLLMLALSAFLVPTARAADKVADKAAATVNGQPVKRTVLELIVKDAENAGNKPDERVVLENLVRNELLAQEAIRIGIDRQPDFATREEMLRKELLANLMVKDFLRRNPIAEETLKAEYENFKAALGNKEYSARHIQVQTEAEAKEVIARLAKGADFAKLAAEKSKDAATRDKGGLIGWFAKGAITPPLGEAAAKLQKGLFTTVPLQTQAGWHVLKLDDVRDFQPPSYDNVKDRLRQRLAAQQARKLMEDLRAKASIELAK